MHNPGHDRGPEWEFDLDYNWADEHIAELDQAYSEHNEKMMTMFTEWGEAKQTIDNYYWQYEFKPLLEEEQQLDERTMRTIITWIVDGTQVKGKPLVEVFPGVEEYMLNNYDRTAVNLTDKFAMNAMFL